MSLFVSSCFINLILREVHIQLGQCQTTRIYNLYNHVNLYGRLMKSADLRMLLLSFLQVHEPKTKVDLTKYLENHKFRYKSLNTQSFRLYPCISLLNIRFLYTILLTLNYIILLKFSCDFIITYIIIGIKLSNYFPTVLLTEDLSSKLFLVFLSSWITSKVIRFFVAEY